VYGRCRMVEQRLVHLASGKCQGRRDMPPGDRMIEQQCILRQARAADRSGAAETKPRILGGRGLPISAMSSPNASLISAKWFASAKVDVALNVTEQLDRLGSFRCADSMVFAENLKQVARGPRAVGSRPPMTCGTENCSRNDCPDIERSGQQATMIVGLRPAMSWAIRRVVPTAPSNGSRGDRGLERTPAQPRWQLAKLVNTGTP